MQGASSRGTGTGTAWEEDPGPQRLLAKQALQQQETRERLAVMQPVSDAARAAAGFARPSDEGGLPSVLFRREAAPPPPPPPLPLMKPALAKPSDLHRVSARSVASVTIK